MGHFELAVINAAMVCVTLAESDLAEGGCRAKGPASSLRRFQDSSRARAKQTRRNGKKEGSKLTHYTSVASRLDSNWRVRYSIIGNWPLAHQQCIGVWRPVKCRHQAFFWEFPRYSERGRIEA